MTTGEKPYLDALGPLLRLREASIRALQKRRSAGGFPGAASRTDISHLAPSLREAVERSGTVAL